MGGAIGLMMSDGSSGFPFTRMNPPGAAAAVNPLADGIILDAEREEGKRDKDTLFVLRERRETESDSNLQRGRQTDDVPLTSS